MWYRDCHPDSVLCSNVTKNQTPLSYNSAKYIRKKVWKREQWNVRGSLLSWKDLKIIDCVGRNEFSCMSIISVCPWNFYFQVFTRNNSSSEFPCQCSNRQTSKVMDWVTPQRPCDIPVRNVEYCTESDTQNHRLYSTSDRLLINPPGDQPIRFQHLWMSWAWPASMSGCLLQCLVVFPELVLISHVGRRGRRTEGSRGQNVGLTRRPSGRDGNNRRFTSGQIQCHCAHHAPRVSEPRFKSRRGCGQSRGRTHAASGWEPSRGGALHHGESQARGRQWRGGGGQHPAGFRAGAQSRHPRGREASHLLRLLNLHLSLLLPPAGLDSPLLLMWVLSFSSFFSPSLTPSLSWSS